MEATPSAVVISQDQGTNEPTKNIIISDNSEEHPKKVAQLALSFEAMAASNSKNIVNNCEGKKRYFLIDEPKITLFIY